MKDAAILESPPPSAGSEASAEVSAASCANCGATLAGQFCHECGEKRPDERDLSVRRFLYSSAQEIVDLEHSKFFQTLRHLLFSPGHLTNEYLGGRKTRYYTPLKLFITLFTLSFLLYTAYKPTAVYDIGVLIEADQSGRTAREFDKLAALAKVEPRVFVERINERLGKYFTWTQHLPVLLLSFFMIFLYWDAHRYFIEHLVFSIHLMSFAYLLAIILWPVMLWVGVGGFNNLLLAIPMYILMGVYFYRALRRVYKQSTRLTLVKTVVLVVCYFVTVLISFYSVLIVAVVNAMRAS
jgi:hypothetical protein